MAVTKPVVTAASTRKNMRRFSQLFHAANLSSIDLYLSSCSPVNQIPESGKYHVKLY
ncbi:hypothetical protein ACPUYX_16825 [Desulfosporosinus sp. SYSU MS00001]|uniref:hypothetical protein n=1 Tax=Desulfosporosinus sp. SYSU MS00001 TaxID=3416284 RepID=UPI003CED9F45